MIHKSQPVYHVIRPDELTLRQKALPMLSYVNRSYLENPIPLTTRMQLSLSNLLGEEGEESINGFWEF